MKDSFSVIVSSLFCSSIRRKYPWGKCVRDNYPPIRYPTLLTRELIWTESAGNSDFPVEGHR